MEPTADDVLRMAEAWASPDDWNVPSIYPSILRELVDEVRAGTHTVDEQVARVSDEAEEV